MSLFSSFRRAEVHARAGERCEYCHLPTRGQVATFPIDHIIPKSTGAGHDLENLALACPPCNAHKWTAVEWSDPITDRLAPLFHPRRDEWNEHFRWVVGYVLAGATPSGHATVAALQMNNSDMVELRRLLAGLDLFPESEGI